MVGIILIFVAVAIILFEKGQYRKIKRINESDL